MISVRIVGSDQRKVVDWMLDGKEPELQEDQLISLSTVFLKITETGLPRVMQLATAIARLSIISNHVDGPALELSITGRRLGDVRELCDSIAEMAYGIRTLVIKPAPIAPPKPEDPSAWRMIRDFVRGLGYDCLRLGRWEQRICSLVFRPIDNLNRRIFFGR